MISLHLLAQGAVLPQVFDVGKSGVGVRWLPAMLDETVQALTGQLARLLPSGLLTYRNGHKEINLSGEA